MIGEWLWLACLLVGIAVLSFFYWYRRPKRFPPGPRGIPILGYLPMLQVKSEQAAYKLSKKYGPVVAIRTGREDMIYLNDYDSIIQGYVKNGKTLSGRRVFPPTAALRKGLGLISLDYGDEWKAQRKFGLMTLRGFGVGKKEMENICNEEMKYLLEEIRGKNGKPFYMSGLLHKVFANNLCSIVLGKRFDYYDKDFEAMLYVIIDMFAEPSISFSVKLTALLPLLKYIPPISYHSKKYYQSVENLLEWMDKIVKEHEKTFDENNLRDFIDAYISEKRKETDKSFTNFQLLNYIYDLFLAGSETTGTTMVWAMLCLLHYPSAQKKLREEISKVVGSSEPLSTSKKAEMPYTNAFIQELFRYRTLIPFSVFHKANADTELYGYVIPKETKIRSNLWAVHNNSNLWKEPEKFIPERFLDHQGNFVNSNYVIPFSVGPRHCVGDQLAKMEVFISLVKLVRNFEFLPDPNVEEFPSIDDVVPSILTVPKSFKIVAIEV